MRKVGPLICLNMSSSSFQGLESAGVFDQILEEKMRPVLEMVSRLIAGRRNVILQLEGSGDQLALSKTPTKLPERKLEG